MSKYKTNLSEGDTINELTITKTTDKSCWLDNKRYSWGSIDKLMNSKNTYKTKFNLNKKIDWSCPKSVQDYYDSFIQWGFYVCKGDIKKENLFLIEVKNGMVFYNNEYYLPAPRGSFNNPNEKIDVEDGWYYAYVFKRHNSWFGNSTNYKSNIFYIRNSININPSIDDIKKLKPNNTEIYCRPYGDNFCVEYTQSGRDGLEIYNIFIRDFKKFFIERYCSQQYGYDTEFIKMPDDILNKIMYGNNGFNITLEEKLNKILNSAKYNINDDESYGEYSLNYIEISKEDCKLFFDEIQKAINLL